MSGCLSVSCLDFRNTAAGFSGGPRTERNGRALHRVTYVERAELPNLAWTMKVGICAPSLLRTPRAAKAP